jgi:hypothetical protein
VATAAVMMAEPQSEITAAHADRSDALQNESAYRVFVFT